MYKYSVLMYNFNNYELFREPLEIDPECEYIYVTDNENFKSNKWKVIVDKDLEDLSVFDKCYRVRFNLFKYATTPVCIYLDGSFAILKSLRCIYDAFMKSEADLGLCVHPYRNNIIEEYKVWVTDRQYPIKNVRKILKYMAELEYPAVYKGLYQGGMRICKNTELNKKIDDKVFNTLVMLGEPGKIERIDQTIYSLVLNTTFKDDVKIFPFAQQVFQNDTLSWKLHGANVNHPAPLGNYKSGYVFNKEMELFNLL